MPGDHGGEGDHHQESVNASFEPISTVSVFTHLEEDSNKEYREEAEAAEGDEGEENFEERSQADPI